MNGHALLEARGVTVRFGGLTAVDGVSAAFAAGQVCSGSWWGRAAITLAESLLVYFVWALAWANLVEGWS